MTILAATDLWNEDSSGSGRSMSLGAVTAFTTGPAVVDRTHPGAARAAGTPAQVATDPASRTAPYLASKLPPA